MDPEIWFSFLIHPRNTDDLLNWPGTSLLLQYSDGLDDLVRKANTMEPVVVGDVTFGPNQARGELIGVVRTPDRLLVPSGRHAVRDAVALALNRGSRVVGLGALTAPATAAGKTLEKAMPPGTVLTTGNAYTAWVGFENVIEACTLRGEDRPLVAVVGATGSVGAAVSHLLHEAGYPLLLIGRSLRRLRATLPDLDSVAELAPDLTGLHRAGVVLVVTSGVGAIVSPDLVADGAVVVDMTQPANVDADDPGFAARGARVHRGGLVHVPGLSIGYDLGLPGPDTAYACLAETYLIAREGLRAGSIGVPHPDLARRLHRVAANHGVRPLPLAVPPLQPPLLPTLSGGPQRAGLD